MSPLILVAYGILGANLKSYRNGPLSNFFAPGCPWAASKIEHLPTPYLACPRRNCAAHNGFCFQSRIPRSIKISRKTQTFSAARGINRTSTAPSWLSWTAIEPEEWRAWLVLNFITYSISVLGSIFNGESFRLLRPEYLCYFGVLSGGG